MGVVFLTALVMLLSSGCATRVPPVADANWPQASADAPLVLQAGDSLRIRFPYWSELDEEQAIRPDGKIALNLVGEVKAAGVTPEQLRDELLKLYAPTLKNPEVTVVVKSLDSRRVYIGGEVKTPGVIAMPSGLTLLQAIMQAGGFTKDTAKLNSVVVVRNKDGAQHACTVDVRAMLASPQTKQFVLEPFDIVYVPRTAIDRVDQWIEQYINKVIPRNIYGTFSLNQTHMTGASNGQDVQTTVSLP